MCYGMGCKYEDRRSGDCKVRWPIPVDAACYRGNNDEPDEEESYDSMDDYEDDYDAS